MGLVTELAPCSSWRLRSLKAKVTHIGTTSNHFFTSSYGRAFDMGTKVRASKNPSKYRRQIYCEVGILGCIRKLRGTKWVIWAKTDSRTSSWSLHRSSRTSNRWLASSDPLFFQLEMATSSRAHSTTVI